MATRIVPTISNPLAAEYRRSGSWPQRPLAELLGDTVHRQPQRIAIIDDARRLTFAELDELSRRCAAGLQERGIGAGDVVAYQLPNWWEAVVVFLAAARLGATVNPLLTGFRAAELRFILRQSRAAALVIPGVFRRTDHRSLIAELRAGLPDLRLVSVARSEPATGMQSFGALLAETPDASFASPNPDAVLLLMYTSGTTAAPKGVLHTHNTLAAEVRSLERVHQLGPHDRTLMPSPVTHISGAIHAILTPAVLGTSAVLMEQWNAARAVELIAAERVSYMVGAPTFLQELLAHPVRPDVDVSSLRLFSCGGAGVSPELVRRARQRFPHCVTKRVYGSTEFPTLTTTDADDAVSFGIDTEGRAITPAEVRIVDSHHKVLPPGSEGEVQGRGPECCAGYRDPALNADAFTDDGWFRSGDLGVLDAAGYLRITGRVKDIVIRKGEKISVKEVEDAIAAHPAVAEAVVVALPDPRSGERACAAVRLQPGAQLDLPALTAFLDARGLAKHKWPEQLEIVADFPRTESGKVVRPALVAQINARPAPH